LQADESPQTDELDLLPVGLLILGDDGVVSSANARACLELGFPRSELIGRHIDSLCTAAARLLYHSYVLPRLKHESFVDNIELTLRHANGSTLDVLFAGSRQALRGPHEPRIHCTLSRLRQRNALELRLQQAKNIVDQVPGMLFELRRAASGAYAMVYASQALQDLYGLAATSVHDSLDPLLARVHERDREELMRSLEASASALSPWHNIHRVAQGDAVRFVECQGSPKRDAGTVVWYGYAVDCSERRRGESALREKESAERASRAKSELLARVSHEFRTPLNSILGFAELLRSTGKGVLSSAQDEQLAHIETAGGTLLAVVNDLLEISRAEAQKSELSLEAFALAPFVRFAVSALAPLADKRGIRFAVEEAGQTWVKADRRALTQVLSNLLSNAIKYSHERTPVEVQLALRADHVRLVVRDHGPGLTIDQVARLFEPFNRLGRERSEVTGTGLGLVIARALTQQMGGDLQVEPTPGGGASFCVTLPRAEPALDEPARSTQPPQQRAATQQPALRVLCVEDTELNLVLMKSIFGLRPQYRLTTARSIAEAWAALEQEQPDMVLVDKNLPDGAGEDLFDRMQREPTLSPIPAIAFSADSRPEAVQAALAHGFKEYWTKPMAVAALLEALDRIARSYGAGADRPR
jgi:signal transduction histidine kinase/CheY-like chemotaxis protein